MTYVWVRVALFAVATFAWSARVSGQVQKDAPPPLPTLTPLPPPPWIVVPQPEPLPAPPDAPVPDLGTLPLPKKSNSRLRRAVDRLAPRCLDALTHTCWSSPPGEDLGSASQSEREFAKDMDVGEFNFKNKNYKGAELRFRDALNYKPGEPEATFKLAESLDKQGEKNVSREMYTAYLKAQPNGLYAERARKAIERLTKKSQPRN